MAVFFNYNNMPNPTIFLCVCIYIYIYIGIIFVVLFYKILVSSILHILGFKKKKRNRHVKVSCEI